MLYIQLWQICCIPSIWDNIKNISIGSIGFSFKADTVQTLPQLLSYKKNITYEQSLKMIQDLGNQLISLERRGKTIAFYSLDDVIVIGSRL